MGVCIISAVTNADVAAAVARAHAAGETSVKAYDVATLDASPNAPWPTMALPKVADAGKPRDVQQVVADYRALLVKRAARDCTDGQRVKHAGMIGRAITADTRLVLTNGAVAVCEAGAGTGRPMYDEWTDAGTLTPDVWRAYARVRQFRRPTTCALSGRKQASNEGVRWTWEDARAGVTRRRRRPGIQDRLLVTRERIPT